MKKLIVIIAALSALAGCGTSKYVTPERLDKGLVIVLTGIEGKSNLNRKICHGLDSGGVGWAIELYDWTKKFAGPLYNQQAYERNRKKSKDITGRIVSYKLAYPSRPIVLVGQSGGGGMAIWAAEELPDNMKVDGIIVLAVSLSPNYDLDRALENSRRGLISFYSERDTMLGFGTAIAGTLDGEHTASAGKIGFKIPKLDTPPISYEKLFQIPWHRSMAKSGYTGTHLSSGAKRFVAKYVAPLVLKSHWSEQTIRQTISPKKSQ